MAPTSHICTGVRCPAERGGNYQTKPQQGCTARAHSSRSACPTTHGLNGPVPCRPAGQRGRSVSQRSAAHRKMRMAADACRLAVDERSACKPPAVQVLTKEGCSLEKFQAPGVGDLPGKAECQDTQETACELPGVECDAAANCKDAGVRCKVVPQTTGAGGCDQCKTDEGVVMLTEEALKLIGKDTSLESTKTAGNLFDVVGSAYRNQDDSISEDGFSVESLHLERTAHEAISDMLINEIGLMSSMWDSDMVSVDLESLFQEQASHPETCGATSPDHEPCSSSQSVVTASAAPFARLSSQKEELSCTSSSMPKLDANSPGQLSLLTLTCDKNGENPNSESVPANCVHQAADVTLSARPPLPRHSIAETVRHLPVRPGQESSRASILPARPSSRAASPASHRAATCRSPRPSPLQSQDVLQMPEQASPRPDHASGTPLNACRARRKADQSGYGATTHWMDGEDQNDSLAPDMTAASRPSSLTRSYGALGAEIHRMDTPKIPSAHQVLE